MTSKAICLLALTFAFMMTSCSKKSSPAPSSTTTTTTNYPYYFRFNLNGVGDTIVSKNDMKGYAVNTNAILATITGNGNGLWPSIDLNFSLPNWCDTVQESDVMSMIG